MDSQLLNVFTLGVRIGARGIFWVGTKMTYFYYLYIHSLGFPGGASDRRPACQCRRHKRHGFNPWLRKIPWRRSWQPTPVFFPGEFQGQRSLESYSPWDHKEWDMTEQLTHPWGSRSSAPRWPSDFSCNISTSLGLQGACLTADFGLASLYNCISHFLQVQSLCACVSVSLSLHTHTRTHTTKHTPLVRFLWRTLADTPSKHKSKALLKLKENQ